MRIYVKLSDELGERLDNYAKGFGMSKSAFVAYCVGKHIKELDYQSDAYRAVTDKLSTIMDDMSDKERSQNENELPPYPEDDMPDNF